MAAIALAAGAGLFSVAGSIMGQKAEDQKLLDAAKQQGIRNAGIRFGADAQAAMLGYRLERMKAEQIKSNAEIDKAQAQAESDAAVSAAAAGVSGQSVDLVANETERTAQEAKRSLNEQVEAEKLQIKTDYVDTYLNAKISEGTQEFRAKSGKTRFLEAGLSFGSSFLGAYNPGG